MSEQHTATASTAGIDDTGEWRPFKVWEAQVRDNEAPATSSAPRASKESWDPFAVWKRQVRR